MIFIGDLGGFTGAIIGLPAIFMGWYSEKMFRASIYEELPTEKTKRKKKEQYESRVLQEKLEAGAFYQADKHLDFEDIDSLT